MKITVYLPCNETFVPEDKVEFLDISEDMQGKDVITFKCPECGDIHESKRFG